MSNKLRPEQELEGELERDLQVGRDLPPARLLVFRDQAWLPAVDNCVSYETNMVPEESEILRTELGWKISWTEEV